MYSSLSMKLESDVGKELSQLVLGQFVGKWAPDRKILLLAVEVWKTLSPLRTGFLSSQCVFQIFFLSNHLSHSFPYKWETWALGSLIWFFFSKLLALAQPLSITGTCIYLPGWITWMWVSYPRSHHELMSELGLLLLIVGRLVITPMLKAIYSFYYKSLLLCWCVPK